MREPLDGKALHHPDGADLRHAADIVAAEIEQHQMLRALLRIGQQLGLERQILCRVRTALARAGQRADRHHAVAQPHQNFRAGADGDEIHEIQIEQKRRRIDPPQAAIERERRQRERRLEALARHHLEHVPGANIILRRLHHGEEFLLLHVGGLLQRRLRTADELGHRLFQRFRDSR